MQNGWFFGCKDLASDRATQWATAEDLGFAPNGRPEA